MKTFDPRLLPVNSGMVSSFGGAAFALDVRSPLPGGRICKSPSGCGDFYNTRSTWREYFCGSLPPKKQLPEGYGNSWWQQVYPDRPQFIGCGVSLSSGDRKTVGPRFGANDIYQWKPIVPYDGELEGTLMPFNLVPDSDTNGTTNLGLPAQPPDYISSDHFIPGPGRGHDGYTQWQLTDPNQGGTDYRHQRGRTSIELDVLHRLLFRAAFLKVTVSHNHVYPVGCGYPPDFGSGAATTIFTATFYLKRGYRSDTPQSMAVRGRTYTFEPGSWVPDMRSFSLDDQRPLAPPSPYAKDPDGATADNILPDRPAATPYQGGIAGIETVFRGVSISGGITIPAATTVSPNPLCLGCPEGCDEPPPPPSEPEAFNFGFGMSLGRFYQDSTLGFLYMAAGDPSRLQGNETIYLPHFHAGTNSTASGSGGKIFYLADRNMNYGDPVFTKTFEDSFETFSEIVTVELGDDFPLTLE